MKYLNLFLLIAILASLCNANVITKYIQKYQDSQADKANYAKVVDIEKDINFNKKRTLDVYYKKDEVDEKNLKPVVIHIYGGIWIKGSKIKFTNIGSLLKDEGYVAVLPNYGLFPTAVFEDMVDDVYGAINWTFENIKKYGGDPNRITITGHSAGAHLITLSIFKSYLQMKNNKKVLNPLPEIQKVVLLAGPYNFDDYSLIKKYFGTEVSDSLLEQFVKVLFRTKTVSPHDIVASLGDGSITDSFNIKKWVFYYTANDERVPASSSSGLIKELNRVCPDIDITYVYNEEPFGHSDIVNGIRRGNEEQEDIYLSLIESD